MKIEILKSTILNTNNYFVTEQETNILIEASVSLEKLKTITNHLDAIFITHMHWDHYIHLQEIVEFFNCPVYFRKEGYEKLLNSNTTSFHLDKKFTCNIDKNSIHFLTEEPIIIKDIIVQPIFTNGHTNCGCCYKINNYLFSGDTMFKGVYGRCDLPTSSEEEIFASLKKLLTLPDNIIVYPGHGQSTTIEDEKATYKNIL